MATWRNRSASQHTTRRLRHKHPVRDRQAIRDADVSIASGEQSAHPPTWPRELSWMTRARKITQEREKESDAQHRDERSLFLNGSKAGVQCASARNGSWSNPLQMDSDHPISRWDLEQDVNVYSTGGPNIHVAGTQPSTWSNEHTTVSDSANSCARELKHVQAPQTQTTPTFPKWAPPDPRMAPGPVRVLVGAQRLRASGPTCILDRWTRNDVYRAPQLNISWAGEQLRWINWLWKITPTTPPCTQGSGTTEFGLEKDRMGETVKNPHHPDHHAAVQEVHKSVTHQGWQSLRRRKLLREDRVERGEDFSDQVHP